MDLDNHTRWQATVFPGWSYEGQLQQTLVVKVGYRYERDGRITPLETSRELVFVDEYLGEPESSSVTKAAELVPFKEGFEILIQGRVEPKPDIRLQHLEASLMRDGQPWWSKKLALVGPRIWKSNLIAGLYPGDPGILEPLDICWEHAFGGISDDGEARFDDNPAGYGWTKRQGRQARGKAVPQIEEYPLIRRPGKRYPPAGYGPIAMHWGERAKAFETLDEVKAQEGACPYTQATPRSLFNCAPKDQQLVESPKAGDRLLLKYWYPDHPAVDIDLPKPAMHCVLLGAGKAVKALHPQWDTLIVNTTDQELHLIFRIALNQAELPDDPRLALSETKEIEAMATQSEPEATRQEFSA